MVEPIILTVSALNQSARLLLEEKFSLVWIRGEISNYRRPASGHWYFTLKDDRAQVRCAMFASRNRHSRLQPSDGAEVLLRGRVSLYEGRGDFQIIVEYMEAAGEGALRAAFDALKNRLAAEGLFAAERKRALPGFPKHIAVISSTSGAALRDVLSVVRRRFPRLRVTVLPVAVQGAQAMTHIVKALAEAARLEPNLILLTRGGGGLEDLATFNSEPVARAIAACPVPTVSAIGHETDFTIADFVADLRAPTPSAAAEMITPDGPALAQNLATRWQRLIRAATVQLELSQHRLDGLQSRTVNPNHRLHQLMQRADDCEERLHRNLTHGLERNQGHAEALRQRLQRLHPKPRIRDLHAAAKGLLANAERLTDAKLRQSQRQAEALARTLEAVGPLNALARGFAIVTHADGAVLTRAGQVKPGETIKVNFRDGAIDATAQRHHPPPARWRTQAPADTLGYE